MMKSKFRDTKLFSRYYKTRWGWCPRTGKGQWLMVKEAVSEHFWLATCQSKIYENKFPPARHENINS